MGGYNKEYSVRNPINIAGGGEPNLTSQTIIVTQNGYQTWNASDYGNYDGFSDVQLYINVSLEKDLSQYNLIENKTITSNDPWNGHWYYASSDNCDGYKSVTIDVSFQTSDVVQDISYNGNYKSYYYYNYGNNYMKTFTANVKIDPYIYFTDQWHPYTYTRNKIISFPNRSDISLDSASYGTIGKYAAYKNDNLRTLSITNIRNLTTIEESAFENCTNLFRVDLPGTITSIGSNTFKNTRISDIYFNGSKSDWDNITFGTDWITTTNENLTSYSVYCNDDTLAYNY